MHLLAFAWNGWTKLAQNTPRGDLLTAESIKKYKNPLYINKSQVYEQFWYFLNGLNCVFEVIFPYQQCQKVASEPAPWNHKWQQGRFVLKRQEQWITKSGVDVCWESSARNLFFRNPYSRFAARWNGQSFFSLLTCPLSLLGHQQKLKNKTQNLPYTSWCGCIG